MRIQEVRTVTAAAIIPATEATTVAIAMAIAPPVLRYLLAVALTAQIITLDAENLIQKSFLLSQEVRIVTVTVVLSTIGANTVASSTITYPAVFLHFLAAAAPPALITAQVITLDAETHIQKSSMLIIEVMPGEA